MLFGVGPAVMGMEGIVFQIVVLLALVAHVGKVFDVCQSRDGWRNLEDNRIEDIEDNRIKDIGDNRIEDIGDKGIEDNHQECVRLRAHP